jgi:hypothetical protein
MVIGMSRVDDAVNFISTQNSVYTEEFDFRNSKLIFTACLDVAVSRIIFWLHDNCSFNTITIIVQVFFYTNESSTEYASQCLSLIVFEFWRENSARVSSSRGYLAAVSASQAYMVFKYSGQPLVNERSRLHVASGRSKTVHATDAEQRSARNNAMTSYPGTLPLTPVNIAAYASASLRSTSCESSSTVNECTAASVAANSDSTVGSQSIPLTYSDVQVSDRGRAADRLAHLSTNAHRMSLLTCRCNVTSSCSLTEVQGRCRI